MYLAATLRSWASRRRRRTREPHGLILLYHRIACAMADPWNLAVSPKNFRGHLEVLRRIGHVAPLTELPERMAR